MSIEVIEDQIEGASYRVNLTNRELHRMYTVHGLPQTSASGVLLAAISAVDTATPTKRVPEFGSQHPDDPFMIADDYELVPFVRNSRVSAKVTVLYHPVTGSPFGQPVIEFNGTSRSEETSHDALGEPVFVSYSPPGADGLDLIDPPSMIGRFIHQKALGILTVERVEYEDPTPKLAYLDRINSNTFWGQPKYTWKVCDICIRKLLYTSGFNVKYFLEYDWQTHIKTVYYRDPITDQIPADVDTNPDVTVEHGHGFTNVQANLLADFSGLNLPNSFSG